jgi:hypothetical protein
MQLESRTMRSVTVAARLDSRSEATVPELPDIVVYIEALAPDLGGWERDSGSQSAQGRLIEGNGSAVELGQVADDG